MLTRSLRRLTLHGFRRFNYYEWGDPENPRVLVCVHGMTRNGRDFDYLARALSGDYRVLCPDIVGRGSSPWLARKQDYNYPAYVKDMRALVARGGARQVDWVGTSMGGLIGMLLASLPGSRIRRLVMNDVGPFIPKAALERLSNYVGKVPTYATFEEFEQYVRVVCAPFGRLTDDQWQHLARTGARQLDDGRWTAGYDPALALAFQDVSRDVNLWSFYDAVRCPTLVLRGAESDLLTASTAQEMTRRGPKAKLVEVPGVGHAPMLMDGMQIGIIRDFLKG
jgi:pimeloyl-ACP methyl ester carboxylesterase